MADNIRNPFNPMRFTGRGGLLTVEEASRLQDLIKGAGDTYARTMNQILQQFDVSITTVTTTPGPQGASGVPGMDGADGEDGRPGRDGAAGARGDRGAPGLDGSDGDDGWPGPPGRDGRDGARGASGVDGSDGDDAPVVPGPRGPAGRDGLMMMFEAPGEDASEAPPLLIVPPRAPFVLALGYGPDNFSGTLPTLPESIPHFWLHPFTSMQNVSAISVGSSNDLGIIDWEVGGSFSKCELDIFVRTAAITGDGLDVAVTKNGTDTICTAMINNSETDQRHYTFVNVGFADGDRVGVHVSARSTYVSGSLIAQFVARLS